jgi:outer membrane protein assembly factor BamB
MNVKKMFSTGLGILLCFSLFYCKKKSDKKPTPKPKKETTAVTPPPQKLIPLWEKEMKGFILGAGFEGQNLYTITYGGTRKRLNPTRQSLFELKTGVMKWQKKRSMTSFKYRIPRTVQFAMGEESLYYLSKYKNLIPLALNGGGAGKSLKTKSGFIDLGDYLFLADAKPYFLNLKTWEKEYIPTLTEKKKGVPVKINPRFPVRKVGSSLLFRTMDGYLRAVNIKTKKESWSFTDPKDSKKWVYDLPGSKELVLVPVIYPNKKIETLIKFPTAKGDKEITFPGKVLRRHSPFLSGNLFSIFITKGKNSYALATLDIKDGKLLYVRDMPTIRCSQGKESISCRDGSSLLVYSLGTGEQLLKKDLGKKISFVSASGSKVAVQLSDGSISIIDIGSGKIEWTKNINIKSAPCFLKSLEYGEGDRVAILVRTEWDTAPRLNRYYLRIFSLSQADSFIDMKLGKPFDGKRDSRISIEDNEVDPITPVWTKGGVTYSAVEGLFMAIDIKKGRKIKGFKIPYKKENAVSYVGNNGGVFLLESGNWLIAISSTLKIVWKKSIKNMEFSDKNDLHIVYRGYSGFKIFNIKNGKEVKNPFLEATGARFIAFYNGAWFLKQGKKSVKWLGGEKTTVKKLPNRYFHALGKDIHTTTIRTSMPEKASWTAINGETGKIVWSYKFKEHPSDMGTASSIAQLEPKKGDGESPWWAVGTDKGFVISGVAHRCIHMISPSNGKVLWVRCFHRLGGAPIKYKSEKILISATGPFGIPGKPFVGENTEGEGRLEVFSIELKNGKVTKLYRDPEFSIHLPLKVSPGGDILILTKYKEKRRIKKSFLKAFKLNL